MHWLVTALWAFFWGFTGSRLPLYCPLLAAPQQVWGLPQSGDVGGLDAARPPQEQSPQRLQGKRPCFSAAPSSPGSGLGLWHAWGLQLPLQILLQLKRDKPL